MLIRSLGRKTDFIFARFSGSVINKEFYTLIQTPSNPNYHWGNYIIFDRAPQPGDLKKWKHVFDTEFSSYSEPHHYLFTWDTGDDAQGDYQEFIDANFEFYAAVVLTATQLKAPFHLNKKLQVRKILSDKDWADVTLLQTLCADPKFVNEHYLKFKQQEMAAYRKMSDAGKGSWFGAFKDGQLVGDLGIFYEGKVARYQNVGTHPDHRRQSVCGTLVYQSGLTALEEFGVDHLVMEADTAYHAAKIYESVGFERHEVNHSLSWWPGKDSGT